MDSLETSNRYLNSICRKYYDNLKKYNDIENYDYLQHSSGKELLAALSANTKKKRDIYGKQNSLLDRLFAILNDDSSCLDRNQYDYLNRFAIDLSESVLDLDNEISFRIHEKLLEYGKRVEDYSVIVESIYWCGISEWKYSVLDSKDFSCTYFFQLNQYREHFGELRIEVRRRFIAGIMNQMLAYTHREAGPLLKKGREILAFLDEIEAEYPDTPVSFDAFRSTVYRNILTATDSFRDRIDDSPENRNYVYEISKKSMDLISLKNDTTIPFDSEYYYDLYTAEFHAQKTNLEEFLDKLDEICRPRANYSRKENFCCVFRNSAFYIEYVLANYEKGSETADKRIKNRVSEVMSFISTVERNEDTAAVNRYIFKFVEATIDILPFSMVREALFILMMGEHRETCVHSIMVYIIMRELFMDVLEKRPEILLGVCGLNTVTQLQEHVVQLSGIVKDMALIHDLGKYKCISIVANCSRKIMNREFAVIKRHPEYGYRMIKDADISDAIKKGILYHHVWHDGIGGYPSGYESTPDQPLIDMLSIADSLDAASDTYGRAYCNPKTLEQLLAEFKSEPNRYSSEIVSVMQSKEVMERLQWLLTEKRDALHIYVCKKQYKEMVKSIQEETQNEIKGLMHK